MNKEQPLSRYSRDRSFRKIKEKQAKREARVQQQGEPVSQTLPGPFLASSTFEEAQRRSLEEAKRRRQKIEESRALSSQDRDLMRRLVVALEENTSVMRQAHGIPGPELVEEPAEDASEGSGEPAAEEAVGGSEAPKEASEPPADAS